MILSGFSNLALAQSIKFSTDKLDPNKEVTEFKVDDIVYMHVTTEKPLNETILLDDYYNIPRTRKCTSCELMVYMKLPKDKYPTLIWKPELDELSSKLDYTTNKVVIPLVPLNRIGIREFKTFYDALELGKTEIEVSVNFYGGRYELRKKKRPKGLIKLNKTADDNLKYGASFETDYEAAMVDPVLEEKVVQLLNSRLKDSKTDYIWKAAKIASKDWGVVRDRYNGAVLGRELLFYCYASEGNGKCKIYQYYFIQEFDGVNYFESLHYYRSLNGGRGELVDCTIE